MSDFQCSCGINSAGQHASNCPNNPVTLGRILPQITPQASPCFGGMIVPLTEEQVRRIVREEIAKLGSAETGGEKAAPQNDELHKAAWELSTWAASINWDHRAKNTAEWLDGLRERIEAVQIFGKPETTFPRSPENQTVSSGVEGAHEGTTADNCTKCGRPRLTASSTVASGMMRDSPNYFCTCVALAESSLSQNADSSAPTIPAPLSTQPDTTTEKI